MTLSERQESRVSFERRDFDKELKALQVGCLRVCPQNINI